MSHSTARLSLLVMTATVLVFGPAQAQSGAAALGQEVAKTWCSNCHRVGPSELGTARDAIPSFAAVARMPSTTSMSLHAFLQTPHGQMPDFALSSAEIDNATAYILSLQTPGQ